MLFQKQDLAGTHYNWDMQGKKNVFTGEPSRRSFDRFNGYQVLFLINFCGSLSDVFTLQEGRKIEDAISNHLPNDAKSEISAFNWIHNVMFLRR